MKNLNLVSINNNQVVVSSRQVAESFGKRHDHIIRGIESIISQNPILGSDTKAEKVSSDCISAKWLPKIRLPKK